MQWRQSFANLWFVHCGGKIGGVDATTLATLCRGDLQWPASRHTATCHSGQLTVSWSCVVSCVYHLSLHSWPDGRMFELRKYFSKLVVQRFIKAEFSSFKLYYQYLCFYQIITFNILSEKMETILLTTGSNKNKVACTQFISMWFQQLGGFILTFVK